VTGAGAVEKRLRPATDSTYSSDDGKGSVMRVALVGVLSLFLCGGAAADDRIDASKLVGKWVRTDAKAGTFTIEFTNDGKVTSANTQNGKTINGTGTYKVLGNKLHMLMQMGGKERKLSRTIIRVTDGELVSSDEKGKQSTLHRANGM
jgi:uncharacterized protein (TIGR03066 family)